MKSRVFFIIMLFLVFILMCACKKETDNNEDDSFINDTSESVIRDSETNPKTPYEKIETSDNNVSDSDPEESSESEVEVSSEASSEESSDDNISDFVSEESDETDNGDVSAASSMMKYTYNGLNYWLYTPSNATDDMPLIVYLHGGSGKGDDLELITGVEGFPKYIKDGILSADSYIIFPQCPSDQKGWNTLSTKIANLIRYVCDKFVINTEKISLTGHSMGGTGTWSIALANPNLFYKIAHMSGSVTVNDMNVKKLSRISVWAFVGDDDKIVSPDTSIRIVDELKRIGADAKITVFKSATHFDVPAFGYLDIDINIVKWLIE